MEPSEDNRDETNREVVEVAENKEDVKGEGKCDWIYWVPRLILITVILALSIVALIYSDDTVQLVSDVMVFAEENPVTGPLLLVPISMITTILLLPVFIMTMAAGWAF